MRLGTGVVNVFTRGPAVLAQHAAALQEASGGRFVLGIGSSSNVIVERWNSVAFERPRTRVRETVEFLRAALAGERARPPRGRRRQWSGRLQAGAASARAGADRGGGVLRQRMLRTAGELQTGPFSTSCRCPRLSGWCPRCAPASERPARRTVVRGPVPVLLHPGDPEQTRRSVSWMFAAYATVPVYEAFFRWLGYGSQIDPMVDAWRIRPPEGGRGGPAGARRGGLRARGRLGAAGADRRIPAPWHRHPGAPPGRPGGARDDRLGRLLRAGGRVARDAVGERQAEPRSNAIGSRGRTEERRQSCRWSRSSSLSERRWRARRRGEAGAGRGASTLRNIRAVDVVSPACAATTSTSGARVAFVIERVSES